MFNAGGIEYYIDIVTDQLLTAGRMVDRFNSSARQGFGRTSMVAESVSRAIKGISVTSIASIAAFATIAIKVANANTELNAMARVMGESAEELSKIEFAVNQAGLTLEQFADISKDVKDKLGEFSIASSGAFQDFADVMKMTKEDAKVLAGQLSKLSGKDALQQMVTMMEDAGVSGAQMTFVMESMGNEAVRLLPLLRNNGEEMTRLKSRMDDISEASFITPENKESLSRLKENVDLVSGGIGNLGRAIVADAAPAINDLIGSIAENLPDAILYLRQRFSDFLTIFTSGGFSQYAEIFANSWIDSFNGVITSLTELAKYFGISMSTIGNFGGQTANFIKEAFFTLAPNIKSLGQVLVSSFTDMFNKIAARFDVIATAANDPFNLDAINKAYQRVAKVDRESTAELVKNTKAALDERKESVDGIMLEVNATEILISKAQRLSRIKLGLDAPGSIGKGKGGTNVYNTKFGSGGDFYSDFGLGIDTDIVKPGESAIGKSKSASTGVETFTADDANAFAKSIIESGMTRIEQMQDQEAKLEELRSQSLLNEEMYLQAMNKLQGDMLLERASLVSSGFDSILTITENFSDKQSGIYKAMFALQKGFAIAQAAVSLAQNVSQASAVGFPYNIPFITGALAQGAQISSMLSSANYQGGRRFGGNVISGGMYEVNESGVPEIYSAGGKDFMMASENAKVTPMSQMGGGGVNVTINNAPGYDSVQTTDSAGNVTIDIVRQEVAKGRRGAASDVAADISSGNGKISRSLKQSFGLQQKAGSGR